MNKIIKGVVDDVKFVWKWLKYGLIVIQSEIQGKSVVNFFGSRYIVSGNIVKKLG